MKRVLMVLVLTVVVVGALFAQNGYKNLSWGMSPTEVEKAVGPLKDVSANGKGFMPTLDFVLNEGLLFFHQDITTQGLVPILGRDAAITLYSASSEKVTVPTYYFANDRLVAVQVAFDQVDVLPTLEGDYGTFDSDYLTSPMWGDFQVVGWRNGDRIIVWDSIKTDFGGGISERLGTAGTDETQTEEVAYIDRTWFEQIEKKSVESFKAKTSGLD